MPAVEFQHVDVVFGPKPERDCGPLGRAGHPVEGCGRRGVADQRQRRQRGGNRDQKSGKQAPTRQGLGPVHVDGPMLWFFVAASMCRRSRLYRALNAAFR